MKKLARMDALSLCRLHERGKDAVGFNPAFRAIAEADLPHNYHFSQGLLRMIVRGRHAGDAQESEKVFLVRTHEEGPQGFGRLEGERPAAYSPQFMDETLFNVRRIRPGDLAGFQFLSHVTGP